MSDLLHIPIKDYVTHNGSCINAVKLTYQTFGQPLHTAPIVLVNHALTGNSNVSGKDGWWSSLIGDDKVINTKRLFKYNVFFSVLVGQFFEAGHYFIKICFS